MGIGEPCVVPWAGRAVIAHARAGRDADAARVLGWLDSCAARLPCRWPRVAAAFGRAELAARHGDHQASERHFREALVLHDDAELPMERVSTLLAYGNMLRQSGQPARARKVLAEALEMAEATGAPALARYARDGVGIDRRKAPSPHPRRPAHPARAADRPVGQGGQQPPGHRRTPHAVGSHRPHAPRAHLHQTQHPLRPGAHDLEARPARRQRSPLDAGTPGPRPDPPTLEIRQTSAATAPAGLHAEAKQPAGGQKRATS